jgi:hypothetical protein
MKILFRFLVCLFGMFIFLMRDLLAGAFNWPPARRPEITLVQALEIAERTYHIKPEFYCIRADVTPEGDARSSPGGWNLFYGSMNGAQKAISVHADNTAEVSFERPSWEQLSTKTSCIGVEDALHKGISFFSGRGIRELGNESDASMSISYKTRKYLVHQRNGAGFMDAVELNGPDLDGFIIRMKKVTKDSSNAPSVRREAYWTTSKFYILTQDSRYQVEVNCDWGLNFDYGITILFKDALGESTSP